MTSARRGVLPATSLRMSRVRHRDTAPELIVKRKLRKLGLRFRCHLASLPGSPDITLLERRVVIRVNGCFWHGHRCRRGRLPASNRAFWRAKIARNRLRDRQTRTQLRCLGWKVLTVWECQLPSMTAKEILRRLKRLKLPRNHRGAGRSSSVSAEAHPRSRSL